MNSQNVNPEMLNQYPGLFLIEDFVLDLWDFRDFLGLAGWAEQKEWA